MRTALIIAVLTLVALVASSEIALAQILPLPGQAYPYSAQNPAPFPVITPVPGLANVLNYGRPTQSETVRPAVRPSYEAPIATPPTTMPPPAP